jgi:hypothetical protein
MFEVALFNNKNVQIEADGFKTTENGQLVLYIYTEGDRNRTVAVFAQDIWQYFIDKTPVE